MKQFRPMLAAAIESVDTQVQFPVLASPKLDGIRAVVREGRLLSRSLKLIPNEAVRALLEGIPELEGCDGELMIENVSFQVITSTFMTRSSHLQLPSRWYFGVFDHVSAGMYFERAERVKAAVAAAATIHVQQVPQTGIHSAEALTQYEVAVLSKGYEGVILRRPSAQYKYGRSTINEGALLKLKRFSDSEAQVIGFIERMHNTNEATVSEIGTTKRSSAKAGKVANGALGALQVRDLKSSVEFEIGTGFSEAERVDIWLGRENYAGKIVRYRHFAIGAMDKPRFPAFAGWRSTDDLDQ